MSIRFLLVCRSVAKCSLVCRSRRWNETFFLVRRALPSRRWCEYDINDHSVAPLDCTITFCLSVCDFTIVSVVARKRVGALENRTLHCVLQVTEKSEVLPKGNVSRRRRDKREGSILTHLPLVELIRDTPRLELTPDTLETIALCRNVPPVSRAIERLVVISRNDVNACDVIPSSIPSTCYSTVRVRPCNV